MLKVDCKYVFFLYIVKRSKVASRISLTIGGSSTTLVLDLSSKIYIEFEDVLRSELLVGLSPHRSVEHRVDLILGCA